MLWRTEQPDQVFKVSNSRFSDNFNDIFVFSVTAIGKCTWNYIFMAENKEEKMLGKKAMEFPLKIYSINCSFSYTFSSTSGIQISELG